MRKFFYETKMITIVAVFAIVVAIGLDFTCYFRFKNVISNVCYSVIAAYIFYLIQIYFPERKKKRLLATRIRGYIVGRILDKMSIITRIIDKNTRESLSEEDADLIIEEATEAYNNLFKCIDDFAQAIDDNILDVVVGLSENQFLYDLYYLGHAPDDNFSNRDYIYDLYEEYRNDFKNLIDRLGKLVKSLPVYDKELSDNVKKRINQS